MHDSDGTVTYRFFNTDETGWDEYDIEGDQYLALIDICCQYCSVVSFDIYPKHEDAEYLKQIQKYMVKRDNTYKYFGAFITGSDKRFYTVCPEICDLLKKEKNMFSWFWQENNPFHFENLTFYRKDGSVFFESITHEGECDLIPKEEENVDRIVSNGHWVRNPKLPQHDIS